MDGDGDERRTGEEDENEKRDGDDDEEERGKEGEEEEQQQYTNIETCRATSATITVALCACTFHKFKRIYAGEIGREIEWKGGNRGVFRGNRP